MDTCMCMAESLHCSPEATIVSQLYPIQNAFSVKKDKNKKNFLKILKMVQIKKKKRKRIILHAEMIQEVVRENALVWFS